MTTPTRTPSPAGGSSISLSDAVQYLPGAGPRRAAFLAKLGIRTVGDLLEHFPQRFERQESRLIAHLEEGIVATVAGRVIGVGRRFGRNGPTLSATLLDNTGQCRLTWFNAPWMADRVRRGMNLRATGRVTAFENSAQLLNPSIEEVGDDPEPINERAAPRLVAVYPATAEISSRDIARLIESNLDRLLPLVEELFPPSFLNKRKLSARCWSIAAMHRPLREADVDAARRRLAHDELLLLQMAVLLARRRLRQGATADSLPCGPEVDRRIRARFPFPLTEAQDRAVRAIVEDMSRPRPMNRLLQGDVGCGKTAVAVYAALAAVANHRQVAVMAPTELLAQQHYASIHRLLEGSRVRDALLTGRLSAAQRKRLSSGIEAGEIDLVVGTQALIQESVRFARLGLVIVDEQHRFGVRQRAMMRGKGPSPHYLVMTATPIPRTLSMTLFGDLDVTTIDALPPGRVPIVTRVVEPREADHAWDFVRARLVAGERAYVVYPLVDESDKLELRAATTEFARLRDQVFAGFRVGLTHGRMKSEERTAVMSAFARGDVQVLVATTVIEVGIDVPAATCMVIEHAERYGLSQLHQLRGRVGRGGARGYCFLLTGSDGAGNSRRLDVLAKTTDGFRIAEEDLMLRGPGELLGTRQHGLPELRVADLSRDGELLRAARRDAEAILRADPELRKVEHEPLRRVLEYRYAQARNLLGAG